jgi:hypothetical protein
LKNKSVHKKGVIVLPKSEVNPKKKKKAGPNFVLTLKLDTEKYQEDILDKRLDIGRRIYNACLNELYKRYHVMVESKDYRKAIKLPKTDEKRNAVLKEITTKYRLTEYSMHQFVKPMQHHFKVHLDSLTVQKTATRCFEAFKKKIYHTAKKIHFKKFGELQSLEGKNNDAGIRFKDQALLWNGLSIKVIIHPKDAYAQMALTGIIKYCRVLKKGLNYYIQLIIGGLPPVKINNNGEFRHMVGNADSKVGLDIGTQTVGVTSDESVRLLELAPEINTPYRVIRSLQRKMDRSRRATNQNKFSANGTFNRGNRDRWVQSMHYIKDHHVLQRLQGKLTNIRKQSHEQLANEIISLGTEVYVETMSFKGLQKRAKKTSKNKKSGKFNSKKRFGKSIVNKAPAMFLTILENKLKYLGTELHRINTAEVKASQYNHVEDGYVKKELSERWTMIGIDKIQRDLYSSFLIANVNSDLRMINRDQCLAKYEQFKRLHDAEIERLKASSNRKLSSMGL